jgi:hypothetical protein
LSRGGAIGGAIDDSSGAIEDLGGAIEANHRTPTEILVLIQQIRKFLIVLWLSNLVLMSQPYKSI